MVGFLNQSFIYLFGKVTNLLVQDTHNLRQILPISQFQRLTTFLVNFEVAFKNRFLTHEAVSKQFLDLKASETTRSRPLPRCQSYFGFYTQCIFIFYIKTWDYLVRSDCRLVLGMQRNYFVFRGTWYVVSLHYAPICKSEGVELYFRMKLGVLHGGCRANLPLKVVLENLDLFIGHKITLIWIDGVWIHWIFYLIHLIHQIDIFNYVLIIEKNEVLSLRLVFSLGGKTQFSLHWLD